MNVLDNVIVDEIPDRINQMGISRSTRVRVSFEVIEEVPKNKWKKLGERIHKEGLLNGAAEDVVRLSREFRDEFQFKHDSE